MRARGTLVVLASAGAIVVYGACTETRLEPLGPADAGTPEDPAPTDDEGEDAEPRNPTDGGRRDAAADADAEWPCPATTTGVSSFDREWMTGPLPKPSPGAANYGVKSGTVCDRTTLLEWERKGSADLRTWDQAVAYCDTLLVGGHNDWRLPTRIELLTLVDHGRKAPALDPVIFPGTPLDEPYWSATLMSNVFENPNAYFVSFELGATAPFTKTEPLHVRCVRGGR